MQAKAKYYVVWKGRRAGIYSSWEACARQVQGYTGAAYKAFTSREAAERAYRQGRAAATVKAPARQERLLPAPGPLPASLAVDAACSGNPGLLEFRGVNLRTRRVIFHQGPFREGTNNIGEFLAIVHALQYQEEKGLDLPVYSDSSTGMAWVKARRCRTRLAKTRANAALFTLITQAEDWLGQNGVTRPVLKWDTQAWGEIPADFKRK